MAEAAEGKGRSRSVPALKDRPLLQAHESWKASSMRRAPAPTMGGRHKFGDMLATAPTGTELTTVESHKYDYFLTKQPSWTMIPRKSGMSKPPDQPGPGEYPLPGSIYGNHPTIKQPGRVSIARTERPSLASLQAKDVPSPQDRAVVKDGKIGTALQRSAPQFSIRLKWKDPADKEKRPGCQTYDIGDQGKSGKMGAPAWTMAPRSSAIPKPPQQPGPGAYPMPGSIYGAHPTIPQPGRVPQTKAKRFTYPEPDDRPY